MRWVMTQADAAAAAVCPPCVAPQPHAASSRGTQIEHSLLLMGAIHTKALSKHASHAAPAQSF